MTASNQLSTRSTGPAATHRAPTATAQRTIHEASEATGWSPRMLRYVESLGLVHPDRSPAGYRLYGAVQLDRLRSLRELVDRFGIELGDVGFTVRLSTEPDLRLAVDEWLAGEVSPAARPAAEGHPAGRLFVVPEPDWLGFEQDKQLRLLAVAGSSAGDRITKSSPGSSMFPTPRTTSTTTNPIASRKEIA